VAELFADESAPVAGPVVKEEKGHGRRERREIVVSQELAGWEEFPGLAQVARIKTTVREMKSAQERETVHYLITSLTREQASPKRLMALIRKHWRIENSLFHVKDDSFGEDRHVLQSHRRGAVMSLLRAVAIDLLRGESPAWSQKEPLTSRAEAVYLNPLRVLFSA
jgi:predicted transposase YbfD/YdcC